ncbi:restriction endonuclease subunit S [Serratia liquefaciens]|uniref:restriction endonuclease subunit S n=1 Tax=Serratia liquefaciens TaxID=614 RepID=UPI002182C889|nr:restriction endonuclease subunit S [Serratia liquefaciens]CAI2492089.1 Type I restriction enzyme EcoKI specificity protein [Serratia liquefaciens]
MVPEGWEIKALKDILSGSIRNGFSPIASDKETGFWVLGLGSLGDEGINVTEIKPVEPTDRVLQTKLSHGDFLVSRSNTPDKVGRSIYFRGEIENCSYPDLMMKFRIDESKAYPLFIEQKLKSSDVRAFLKNCAAGSSATMVKINKGILEKTPLLLPNIKEQKKIAQILSAWDKAITTTEQLLTNSQQQKKALMQQLLNGHTRLPGFSDRWMGGVLGDIATIDSGFAFKSNTFINTDNGIPVIRMNNLKNGRLDISDSVKISPEITKGLEKFSLLENDFLFGMSGSLNNYAWVAAKDLPCYLNQRIGRITAKNNHDQTFLTYLYLSDKVQKIILDKAEGAAQLNISINEIRETPINYPAPKEQKKIAEILLSADNYITKLQKKLHYLKQEKKALMQQLLTGKRRVNVEAA